MNRAYYETQIKEIIRLKFPDLIRFEFFTVDEYNFGFHAKIILHDRRVDIDLFDGKRKYGLQSMDELIRYIKENEIVAC